MAENLIPLGRHRFTDGVVAPDGSFIDADVARIEPDPEPPVDPRRVTLVDADGPIDGRTLTSPVVIEAVVEGGTPDQVRFFLDDSLVQTERRAPYTFGDNGQPVDLAAGTRVIRAVADWPDRPATEVLADFIVVAGPVEPPPPPVPPTPPVPPPVDRLLVLTLNETNCGGDTFTGSPDSGYGRYYRTRVDLEYMTLDWRGRNSKALLASSAGGRLYRCHILGGEDVLHCNGGDWEFSECIFEENDVPSGSHADALQMSSGGAGGSIVASGSLFGAAFRMQNAAFQGNTGRKFEAHRCGFHGGGWTVYGDPGFAGPIDLYDCLYGWGTAQFGPIAGKARDHGGAWWDPRDMRPRRATPYAFDPYQTHNNRGDQIGPILDANGKYLGPPNGTPIR